MQRFSNLILLSLTLFLAATPLWASGDSKHGYQSKFYGTIEVMPEGRLGSWVVNGRRVVVSAQTRIEEEYGQALVGAYVEIKGNSDGQTLQASKIEVKRETTSYQEEGSTSRHAGLEFYGVIRSLPQRELGTWLIDDREVFVDSQTRINSQYGRPTLGTRVEVKGSYQNNTFHARKIEVKQSR